MVIRPDRARDQHRQRRVVPLHCRRRSAVVNRDAACFRQQQTLRASLLDARGAISFAPARDLAAHMLLAIDDVTLAGNIAAQWLLERVQGERVDGNIGSPSDAVYVCGRWESALLGCDARSAKGTTLDNSDPGMRQLWNADAPVVLEVVASAAGMSRSARAALLATGTKTKMIMPTTGGRSVSCPLTGSRAPAVDGRSPWSICSGRCCTRSFRRFLRRRSRCRTTPPRSRSL